jgi:hypothetical protein
VACDGARSSGEEQRERWGTKSRESMFFFDSSPTRDEDKCGGHMGLAVARRHGGRPSQNGEKRQSGGNRPDEHMVTSCRGVCHCAHGPLAG